MSKAVDLLFARNCFSVLLKDGRLMHVYAQECLSDFDSNVYHFQIYKVTVCVLPFESVVNIVKEKE